MSVRDAARYTGMDPWFLHQMKQIAEELKVVAEVGLEKMDEDTLLSAKRMGLSDERLAVALGIEEGWRGEGSRAAEEAGREAGVQAGGYLRGGV